MLQMIVRVSEKIDFMKTDHRGFGDSYIMDKYDDKELSHDSSTQEREEIRQVCTVT